MIFAKLTGRVVLVCTKVAIIYRNTYANPTFDSETTLCIPLDPKIAATRFHPCPRPPARPVAGPTGTENGGKHDEFRLYVTC
jgi:hypothetical protein